MSTLKERLSNPTPKPHFYDILIQYNGYWNNIINGSKIQNKKLQHKIDDLVLEIEQEVSKA